MLMQLPSNNYYNLILSESYSHHRDSHNGTIAFVSICESRRKLILSIFVIDSSLKVDGERYLYYFCLFIVTVVHPPCMVVAKGATIIQLLSTHTNNHFK